MASWGRVIVRPVEGSIVVAMLFVWVMGCSLCCGGFGCVEIEERDCMPCASLQTE